MSGNVVYFTAYLFRSRTDIITPRIFLRIILIVCNFTRSLSAYELTSSWPILDDLYLGWIRGVCPANCSISRPKVYTNNNSMEFLHLLTLASKAFVYFNARQSSTSLGLGIRRLSACTRLPSESSGDPKLIAAESLNFLFALLAASVSSPLRPSVILRQSMQMHLTTPHAHCCAP